MTVRGSALRWARGPGVPSHPGPADLPRYAHHRAWGRRPSWSWAGAGRGSSGHCQGVPPEPGFSPQPLHLHLPHILVPLAFHAPQLRHALLQVGGSVVILPLVVLAAVLGEGGERRETPMSKSSRLGVHWSEHWTGSRGAQLETQTAWRQSVPSTGLSVLIYQMGRGCLAGAGLGWGVKVVAILTLMNCISSLVFFSMCCSRSPWNVCTCVECRVGVIRAVLIIPRPRHPSCCPV